MARLAEQRSIASVGCTHDLSGEALEAVVASILLPRFLLHRGDCDQLLQEPR